MGQILLFLLVTFSSAAGRSAQLGDPEPALPIAHGVAQLFIDEFLIESAQNLERTLHQPVKDNGGAVPVLAIEDEFGERAATLEANGTILYDPRLRKYVMFALGYSVDGKSRDTRENRWKYYRTIEQNGFTFVGPQDVTHFYHDESENRFLGIFKFYSPTPARHGNRLRSRVYAFFDHAISEPFDIQKLSRITLAPPAADTLNETRYDEYYDSTGWRYESLWLGGLKIWHKEGDYPWSAAGCAFLELISSRDGVRWQKVPYFNEEGVPEVFIANGEEGGNGGRNDGGYLTEFTNPPLRIGDELIFYYGCSSWGKNHPPDKLMSGGGIFRARLRVDGFVSVNAGTLTTKPLRIAGDWLVVNASGKVHIEVLNRGGTVKGHAVIEGDAIRHRVRFDESDRVSLRDLAGEVLRLRFSVAPGSRLYSFTIL